MNEKSRLYTILQLATTDIGYMNAHTKDAHAHRQPAIIEGTKRLYLRAPSNCAAAIGIHNGHIMQAHARKIYADVMRTNAKRGSKKLIHTIPSANCCNPKINGIAAIILNLFSRAYLSAAMPQIISARLAEKLTLAEKHIIIPLFYTLGTTIISNPISISHRQNYSIRRAYTKTTELTISLAKTPFTLSDRLKHTFS